MQTFTITVTEAGTLYFFRVVPLTGLDEFAENAGLLVKRSDVALGEEMGMWKVVS